MIKKIILLALTLCLWSSSFAENTGNSGWYEGYPKLFLTNHPDRALIVWKNKEGAYHRYQARFVDKNRYLYGQPFPIHSTDGLIFNRQGEFMVSELSSQYNENYLDSWSIKGRIYDSALELTSTIAIKWGYWPDCGFGFLGVSEDMWGSNHNFLHLSTDDGRAILQKFSSDGERLSGNAWGWGVSYPSICAVNDSGYLAAWLNARQYIPETQDSIDFGIYLTTFCDTAIIDTMICLRRYTSYEEEYEFQDTAPAFTDLCALDDSTYQLFVFEADSMYLFSFLLAEDGTLLDSLRLQLPYDSDYKYERGERVSMNVSNVAQGTRSVFIEVRMYSNSLNKHLYFDYLYFFDQNGAYTGQAVQKNTEWPDNFKEFAFRFKTGADSYYNPARFGDDIYLSVYQNFTKIDSFKAGMVTNLNELRQAVRQDFILQQNYPNPFNPATQIRFYLPKRTQVSLSVYNLLGEKVAQLKQEEMDAGWHSMRWNGLDEAGKFAAAGVYVYRLQAGDFWQSKKMVLIR